MSTPHAIGGDRATILIEGNSQFTAENGVSAGSGTASDPYIIEGLSIDSRWGNGIEIRNTTASFIIRNCTILGSSDYHGIFLNGTSNGAVVGCTLTGNIFGVFLYRSYHCTIANNTLTGNNFGIAFLFSDNNTISGNAASGNRQFGINLDSSSGNTISGNGASQNDCGIFLGLSASNTIAGNAVTRNAKGIYIFSPSNTISGNVISDNSMYGVYLYSYGGNSLSDNTIMGNRHGVYISSSRNNTIDHCDIFGNTGYGVYNDPSGDPVYAVDATDCWWGAPDGPGGVGGGGGDKVSVNVSYDPWLAEPWTRTPVYLVAIEASEGGTTDPSTGGWYAWGQAVPISATPSPGYEFSGWTATGGVTVSDPSASTTSFAVRGSGTVRANFSPAAPTATVVVQPAPGGTITPSGSNSYPEGARVLVRATPLPGYRFANWTAAGSLEVANPYAPSTTLTVNGPGTLTAFFAPLDTDPPVIVDLSPRNGSSVPAGAVTIGASYFDYSPINTSSVALRIDGVLVPSGVQVNATRVAYTADLQPGHHTVELTMGDTFGNAGTVAWSFTVEPPPAAFPLEYVAMGVAAAAALLMAALVVLRRKPIPTPANPSPQERLPP